MPPTILSELSKPNPLVDSSNTTSGPNTLPGSGWPAVDGWRVWSDFNAPRLYEMYKDIVTAPWNGAPNESLTRFDLQVYDEDALEHNVLSKALMPTVNAAVVKARRLQDMNSTYDLNFGRSGRCRDDYSINPDWSLCCEREIGQFPGSFRNLLPGDTKLMIKWHSSFFSSATKQWESPVRQILHYCDSTKCRYGFIITDAELVVFRCTREAIGSGIGAIRPGRGQQLPQGHYRDASGSSAISALSDSMQRTTISPSSSPYQATETGGEYYPLEYRAIPWSNHGDGKRQLTIRLGLFYLALMAGYGPSDIQSDYPSLDSWWLSEDGVYYHNTTGACQKKRPHGQRLEYFDPSGVGTVWVTVGEEQYLTRSSVHTLPIDGRENLYYYLDDGGNRIYVADNVTVYDEHRREFGVFRGLSWVTFDKMRQEEEARERESNKKRRKK